MPISPETEAKVQANIAALSERVTAEYQTAWARKTSLESRAFALFTLTLGIATLYLAVREQLKLGDFPPGSLGFIVLTAALVLTGVSTLAAIIGGWPGYYADFKFGTFSDFLAKSYDPDVILEEGMLHLRIEQLEGTVRTNRRKAIWITIAFAAAGASVIGFAGAIVWKTLGLS
jgi:hypothetical protein